MWSRGFIGLILGLIATTLISSVLAVAVGWHLYLETGSAFDLALIGLIQIIPILALFLVTGWVADHFCRRNILLWCSVAQLLVVLAVAWIINQDEFNKHWLFGALFVSGIARAFFSPAAQSILPNVVPAEHLNRAVALNSVSWNAALIFGPVIAGFLVAVIDKDTYWLLPILGVVTLGGYALLPKFNLNTHRQLNIKQLLGGVHYLRDNKNVFGCMLLDLLIVLFGSVLAILPVFVNDILQEGPDVLGTLRAMPALGATLIGLYLTGKTQQMQHIGRTLFIALTVFSISIIVFAFSTSVWVAMLALFIYGASDMFSVVIRSAVVQLLTPDSLRGRVSALNGIFIASSNELGDFRSGSMAALLGPFNGILLGGLMALGVTVGGAYWFRSLMHMKEIKDPEENRG